MTHDAQCICGTNGIAHPSPVETIVPLYESWQMKYLENYGLKTWALEETDNATDMCNCP
jgi:hypothetical protein